MGLGLAVALASLLACTEPPEHASPPTDSWFRDVDHDKHEFIALPQFLYSPVKPSLVDEAAAGLGDGPLLQLSTSEARRYATDPLQTVRELRPFLIHGLYRSNRVFQVWIADRALWVDSLDDPYDRSPIRRQPLVLYIDEVPPDVYVTVASSAATADRELRAAGPAASAE